MEIEFSNCQMQEADMAGEELVFEVEDNDVPGLEASTVKMQVTYFDTTVSATGNNEVEAMNNVSIEMLKVGKNYEN